MDVAGDDQDSPRWQASRSTCFASPHCYLPPSIVDGLAGGDALWLHYGPMAKDTTPLHFHRAERAPSDRNTGRLDVTTLAQHRSFAGYHVDLYCLDRNPGGRAQRHVQAIGGAKAVGWCVFAVAWREPGGPHVSWVAPGLGLAIEGWNTFFGAERPGAALIEEASKLMDLLSGGGPRRGRPPRWRDPNWRDVVARGEARKLTYPNLSYDDIGRAMGVNPRTYRDYRRLAHRERDDQIRLLEGGQTT